MKTSTVAMAGLLALALPTFAATSPWTLPFQGVATDSTGRPLPDGPRGATFELFDAQLGGASYWKEQVQVVLRKGVFSLELGAQSELPLDRLGRQPLWLSVALDGESTAHPRLPLGKSAESWFAHKASAAQRATVADTALVADSSRVSRRSDTASYAAKAPFGLALSEPLVLSATKDTLKLKPATTYGNFLVWDGTHWVAKAPVFQAASEGGFRSLRIRNPVVGINFIIALEGIFPSRSGEAPFLGEIEMVGFNFAPRGWAKCDGQLLSIAENSALFALLGTTYGGNGMQTFALPDLRGRSPVHVGSGPGLDTVLWGESGGAEYVRLAAEEMPLHTHTISVQP